MPLVSNIYTKFYICIPPSNTVRKNECVSNGDANLNNSAFTYSKLSCRTDTEKQGCNMICL